MATVKITKVEVQKKNKKRYSLYFNEEYAFGVEEETLIKFGLFKGTELTNEEIKRIQEEDEKNRAIALAIRFLARQLRTEKEVQKKLLKAEIGEETIAQVIERLKEMGYLNDGFYAEAFTNTTKAVSRKGPKVVAMELKKKGVKNEKIEAALDEYSIEEQVSNALEIAQKYINRQMGVSEKVAKQKAHVFLMQKGYGSEVIQLVMQELSFEQQVDREQEILAKQADKMIRRHSRKLTGDSLKYKVKQALYQKGFSHEGIEEYIETREWE
ncbi:regulatory protein [Granulicatella balaenopterae]|uniref:Regulatory protein RecX n=1 Tax=Granulicatella balaenopterae TaxID=137733 RepID=A0A1H9H8J9_9LACT|nr:recombination regulator RecX [Granulicatella balaenopterae]SEQ58548.1 regulatory protein [Granulicatella balaenopterae]